MQEAHAATATMAVRPREWYGGLLACYVEKWTMRATNFSLGLLLGMFLSAVIVATNVIWPSLVGHPSPDNQPSESAGWILIIGVVCWAGYFAMQRRSSLRDAAMAGGVITFIAFAMAMFTFIIVDNLFFDLVSQQPEKIWLFERSGFADMRSYLNHTNMRTFWTVLPVVTVFGVICGTIGGAVSRFAQTHGSKAAG